MSSDTHRHRLGARRLAAFSVASLLWTCADARAAGGDSERPRLLLLLTLDQGRADYLERFRPALEGGLAWALEHGVAFTNAHHAHAHTVTAAGHASLSTGRYPAHSGIVGNQWYDRTEASEVYCVEDEDAPIRLPGASRREWRSWGGRSPGRLLATGLGDWVQEHDPESKVFSMGSKDRSAIVMGGRKPDGAFWYDPESGQWVSSRYYLTAYPPWVDAFQRERRADAYAGRSWTPLAVDPALLERLSIVPSSPANGADGDGFPIALGGTSLSPDRDFYRALNETPFVESLLFDFARRLVIEERLGRDDAVDVLALSFSSIDYIGHAYGPDSPELLDALLRLDRGLGQWLDFLDEHVGLERVAVSLSSDHGVAPLPELRIDRGLPARRLTRVYRCVEEARVAFEERFGSGEWFMAPLHFDYETLGRRRVRREDAESFLAERLQACPSVRRVWTRTEIERAKERGTDDDTLRSYARGFHPERSPDLYLQFEKWHVRRSRGTTHGSPYDYDTHVPAVVVWPGVAAGSRDERIETVDLPVTLAALLGVPAPPDVDGKDRSRLFARMTP